MRTLPQLAEILDSIDARRLLFRLRLDRINNRHGFPLQALWRAYITSFALNLPHTNALIRRLQDDPYLQAICGFTGHIPHRTTFNRFIRHLSHYPVLVEHTLANMTDKVKALLPDFGEIVAIDSTTVRSHSNPNRTHISDPEASWTRKSATKAGDKDGKQWHWGYKLHSAVDANYGLPLGHLVTTASQPDVKHLTTLMEHTYAQFPWYQPKAVIADRGYDSKANHIYLMQNSIAPVINIRRAPGKKSFDDLHTLHGQPICLGNQPMDFIGANPHRGLLYRCPADGCHLKDSFTGGIRYCDSEIWENPYKNPRTLSWIPRHTQTWKDLYNKRQAVERFFKSDKENRRLEAHCVRGLQMITLHCLISVLTFQATALVHIQADQKEDMRWMVRKVA